MKAAMHCASGVSRLIIPALVYCLFPVLVLAQSGRRAPKSDLQTQPTPSNQQAEDNEPGKALAPRLNLLVARQPSPKRLASEEAIYASFFNRLTEFESIAVEGVGNLKHSEAVNRARAESESFVVLLQFEIDSYQRGTILLDSPDLEIKYLVFAPLTGKRQSRGKLYYQSLGGPKLRRDNWPKGPPIKITTEAAGIEAAEMLREWIALKLNAR